MTHTNNPTDNNQTSEDGLDTDTQIMHKIDNILYSEHEQPFSKGDALLMLIRNQIEAHIRTEKLKLLDRLDKQIEYNKHDMGEMGEFIRTIYAHNAIEAERTKLEAEL